MDDIIRKRVGDSKNVPDNWVKRRGKPRDPIQHSDPDFNNENHEPTNSFYDDEAPGKAHEQPKVDSIRS